MRTSEHREYVRGGANRISSIAGMLALILGLSSLGTRLARAEVQNDAIGFSTNHVFESADSGEHIDVMTGNLTLTIPLGPRFKLTDDFSYGITFYYNSKIWEHDCPVVTPGSSQVPVCPGTLPDFDTYGLGFSMVPARVYHHDKDKSYVYRVQLEDGSDHFFCDTSSYDYSHDTDTPSPNCDAYTNDSAHISMSHFGAGGWKATTTDGRTITFTHAANSTSVLATRVATTALRPNGDPRAWVDYSYSASSDWIHTITDSHGRTILLGHTGDDVTMSFPSFANSESFQSGTRSVYTLDRAALTFYDPSDGTHQKTRYMLKAIVFPGLNAGETYQFDYTPAGDVSFGWLTQRTLPTGAIIDYTYDVYGTSEHRPYHTELVHKTMTLDEKTYKWSWNRFNLGPPPFPPPMPSIDPEHPAIPNTMSGSNPYQVAVRDPFNNLTVYYFNYTGYDFNPFYRLCNEWGECLNTWDDGLLSSVSTYAGPNPDTAHLIRRVSYTWESDTNASGTHLMFRFRKPDGPHDSWDSPPNIYTMARNSRQVESRTFTPGNGGHTVTVKSSKWYPFDSATPHTVGVSPLSEPSVAPRQQEEYLDGALYRSTYTHTVPSAGNWAANWYTEVKDAAGSVVSHVDRKFTNGQLECEVRRKGTYNNLYGISCGNAFLALGDIQTTNTFDDAPGPVNATGAVTKTTIKGGDVSISDARDITMSYLTTATGENSAFLKAKKYEGGWTWNAVNREVDFNTGLTKQTQDPAGNVTQYQWDGLGRLTSIVPALPEEPTVISYPSLHETKVRQTISVGNAIETVYLYDDLGRLITTKKLNAGGGYDVQNTEFDIAGRVTRKSEWAPAGTSLSLLKWTTYDYTIFADLDGPQGSTKYPDPLGRIHGVTTPDDPTPSTPTTETNYDGDTTIITVRDIKGLVLGSDANVTSTTTYVKDALGRLISVDAPAPGADASYRYDESDNLTEVRLVDAAVPTQAQMRHFDYDNLGRLRLAANPENGTIEYTSYDARGNLLSYKDARQNVFNLTYDVADRLLTRAQGTLQLVRNTYDTATGLVPLFDGGGSAGKLVEQLSSEIENGVSSEVSRVRFNYGVAGGLVNECTIADNGYSGLNGRLVWQSSKISPSGLILRTAYCQDAAGAQTAMGYPDTTNSSRTRTTVAPQYSNGYLVQLTDVGRGPMYITNVTYAAGGVPKEVDRAVRKDLIDLDVRNRPARLQSIGYHYSPSVGGGDAVSCSYAQSNPEIHPELAFQPCGEGGGGGGSWVPYTIWDSGNYAYDMAGNVTEIGNERYNYDVLSRLVHGSIPGLGLTYSIDFAFDAFGNLSSQKKTLSSDPFSPTTRNYTIETQTNRMRVSSAVGGASVNYAYDENGNVISKGATGFTFDADNRLRKVMDPESGRVAKYGYDASGYRVRAESNGLETYYFRDGSGQVLSEFQRAVGNTNPPVWNKDYIYALGKSFALVKNQDPAPPTRPKATNVTTTSLIVNWLLVNDPDIVGYRIEKQYRATATSLDPVEPITVAASATSWSDAYPAAGSATRLTYRVRAMDSAGNFSSLSPPLVVFPNSGSNPGAPTIITPITAGDRSLTIRWTPPTLPNNDLLGYNIYRLNGGSYVLLNDNVLTSAEFVDTLLTNSQAYTYCVRTLDTANRSSGDSTPASGTPIDAIPPGKVSGVFAEASRTAASVNVFWDRAPDLDVASYHIYRSTSSTGTFVDVGHLDMTPTLMNQASYSLMNVPAEQGSTNYFTVRAIDTAPAANTSVPSDQVAVRPRSSTVNTPVIPSNASALTFTIDANGTIDTSQLNMEDDDIIKVVVTWQRATPDDHPTEYHVYRKAADEARFTWVGTVSWTGASSYTFPDTTVTKADYTYYVTAFKPFTGTPGEESAATAASGNSGQSWDHAVKAFVPANVKVRKIYVRDGRVWFTTDNDVSRLATVFWSRVVEPGLVGYNVYRSCEFFAGTAHFNCESAWIRLNATPLAPTQRSFLDASIAGLPGYFDYTVRPVGPDGVEGYIGAVVTANLAYPKSSDNDLHTLVTGAFAYVPDWNCVYMYDCPSSQSIPAATVVNAINGTPRGTLDPAAPVQPPTAATYMVPSLVSSGQITTKYAEVFWTMTSTPKDLLGFYVETAGSPDPNGPWQRLNKRPIAWWERRYVVTGVGAERCNGFSGHTECLNYRVIAVDEDGNESAPIYATNLMPSGATCPATPLPPANLRASNGELVGGGCTTRLDWDAVPGAVEYIVYRATFSHTSFFFYDTQRVVGDNYFIEDGLDLTFPPTGDTCPDHKCAYTTYSTDNCNKRHLAAYYVVARYATGGESPRSNMVFWKCGTEEGSGYTRVLDVGSPSDAIASLAPDAADDSLACWNTAGADQDSLAALMLEPETSATQSLLATAPMTRLGEYSEPDPPWEVLDLHTDHLGSVRAVTNEQGNVVSLHNYFPFGEEVPAVQGSYNTHQYTGHERDKDTGLDYMLARYYEAGVGRFISADVGDSSSFADGQTWNKFVYAANNPLRFIDPDGEAPVVHEAVVYYQASGSTAGEAMKNANDTHGGHAGTTQWELSARVDGRLTSPDLAGGAVSVPTGVTVNVDITTTLPAWKAPADAPAGEQQKFDASAAELKTHEGGHKAIAVKGGERVESGAKAQTGAGKTARDAQADLDNKVQGVVKSEAKKIDGESKTYDKDTAHGLNKQKQQEYNTKLGGKK